MPLGTGAVIAKNQGHVSLPRLRSAAGGLACVSPRFSLMLTRRLGQAAYVIPNLIGNLIWCLRQRLGQEIPASE